MKPVDQEFEVLVPSTGQRRALLQDDIIDVRGRLIVENQHNNNVRYIGDFHVGDVFWEMHPVDYLSMTLVEETSETSAASMVVLAPTYQLISLDAVSIKGGHFTTKIFVADRSYSNASAATFQLQAPLKPPSSQDPNVTITERVRINGTWNDINEVRTLQTSSAALTVNGQLTTQSIPEQDRNTIADVNGPSIGRGVFQAEYELSWGQPKAPMPFGQVWHSVREDATGSWAGFNEMQSGGTGDIGGVCAISAATGAGGDVHYLTLDDAGTLWHTIRHDSGSWDPYRSLYDGKRWDERPAWWPTRYYVDWQANDGGPAGNIGPAYAVTATGTSSGDVHFVAAAMNGVLLHAIRHNDSTGTWQKFIEMGGTSNGIAGTVTGGTINWISAAEDGNGRVCVFATSKSNTQAYLSMAIRNLDGSWEKFANLHDTSLFHTGVDLGDPSQVITGDPGIMRVVAAVGSSPDEVQLMVVTNNGGLMHSILREFSPSPAYAQRLKDVKPRTGDPGPVVAAAGAKGANGDVQWVVTTGSGGIFHTTRHANGTWEPFNEVTKAVAIDPGITARVSAASGGNGSVQVSALTVAPPAPRPLKSLTIAVNPPKLELDKPVIFTVNARDADGTDLNGFMVFLNNVQYGTTGNSITTTFKSTRIWIPPVTGVDGRPHGQGHYETIPPTEVVKVLGYGYKKAELNVAFQLPDSNAI